MRCCVKCGCYLPDKEFSCLACGFDNKSKLNSAGGTGGHAKLSKPEKNPMLSVFTPIMPTLTENSRTIVRKYRSLGDGIVEIRFEEEYNT